MKRTFKILGITCASLLAVVILLGMQGKMGKSEIIKADLAFQSVSIGSAYGATDEQYDELLKEIEEVLTNDKDSPSYDLYLYFQKLDEHGLIRNPYIFLDFGVDSIMHIYLSHEEYEKVKSYSFNNLYEEGKKVELILEIQQIDTLMYYSDNIIEVKKIAGVPQSDRRPLY